MRKDEFFVGDYVHVYNRGNRKAPIVLDNKDRWRFLQSIRYFNDIKSSVNILRDLENDSANINFRKLESVFEIGWPKDWPEHEPLVKILCYCLMPNHYHMLLKEIQEDGVSRFMQKLGGGYTKYFNIRHDEVGSVFQGSYKARMIAIDTYLKYLSVYIQVKNPFELHPGGINMALKEFNKAIDSVVDNKFNSLADFIGGRKSLIIDKDILGELFPTPKSYKEFIYDTMRVRDWDDFLCDCKID